MFGEILTCFGAQVKKYRFAGNHYSFLFFFNMLRVLAIKKVLFTVS